MPRKGRPPAKGRKIDKIRPTGKPPGRPEKEIDWDLVDRLLISGCCGTEIAPHFDMHVQTFYDRVIQKYNMGFTQYQAQKKSQGDAVLRDVQYHKAVSGDNTMLVWLGKNRLKQKETEDAGAPPNDKALDAVLLGLKMLKDKIDAGSEPKAD